MEAPLPILLVDDDEDDFLLTKDVLQETMRRPFTLEWARSFREGLARLVSQRFSVVLLDYRLGERTGLEFLREPAVQESGTPVILLTGQGEREVDLLAMQAGAADYLPKDHLVDTLERTLRHALERDRDHKELRRLNEELERRVAERTAELETANGALRDADRRKDEFIAILAHELRNPLAPITNALAILDEAQSDPEACRAARDTAARQVAHMVRLVDDLLEVSRVSQGKIELRRASINLTDVIQQAVEIARPLMEKQNQQFVLSLASEPIPLSADATRLTQIVGNLLNNASKFTPRGGRIELATRREGRDAVISITDQGIGIEPTQLPRIFELFTQVDSSLTRSQGGLGIGLTLVRNLVRMHGGTIEARSEGLGMGSEFLVRLPLESSASPTALATQPPAATPSGQKRRILVVDDNRDSANTLGMLLKISRHDVQTAYDGESAVSKFQEFQPDVVLMDIGLPGMSGLDAARAIRALPTGPTTTLVAMTGWGQAEDRERTRAAGFDQHLVKPVERTALLQLLANTRTGP